jgi:hypothetical protein
MRYSTIRQIPYSGNGLSGPNSMYVVDMYEDGKKVGTNEFPGKSIHYAESFAQNWDTGIIKNDK